MSVSSTSTFDLDTPRRPGLSDVSNGTKRNLDRGAVPASYPCAEEDNQRAAQIVAAARMIAVARVWVRVQAGSASVYGITSTRDDLVTGDFTPTRVSAGHTTVTWPTGKLPTPDMPPKASLIGEDAFMVRTVSLSAVSARVETKDSAATDADSDFILEIF